MSIAKGTSSGSIEEGGEKKKFSIYIIADRRLDNLRLPC